MSASQSGAFNVQEFTDLGAPLVGGRLYTYAYGTTTQKTAYTDHAGTISHTYTSDGLGGQYIALNSRGEVPGALYLSGGSYDLALKTAAGSTVWTRRADPVWDIVNDLSASSGASLVGYLPAGTGAVSTTVQSQLRNLQAWNVNVKDAPFYAKGDGTTDDTAAITAALTSGAAVVYFPRGTYKTTSQILLTWSGTSLTLVGDGGTQAVNTGTIILIPSGGGIRYDGSGTLTNIHVKGINFKATGSITASTYALTLYRSYINNLYDCVFDGFNYLSGAANSAGVYVTGATGGQALLTRVVGCEFLNNADGIYYDKIDSNALTVDRTRFYANTGNSIRGGDRAGTNSFSFMQWSIKNSDFEGGSSTNPDIYIIGGASGLSIDANYFESSGVKSPIVVSSIGAVTPINNSIFIGAGNTFVGTQGAGNGLVHVQDVNGLTVQHPFAANNLGASIYTVKNTKTGGVWTSVNVETCGTPSGYTKPSAVYDGSRAITGPNYNSDLVPTTYVPTFQTGGSSTGWTYTTGCSWTRVGDLVTVLFRIVVTGKSGTTAGNAQISLPFPAASSADTYGSNGGVAFYSAMSGITGGLNPIVNSLGSSQMLIAMIGAASSSVLTDANFTATSTFVGSLTYRAA